MDFQGVYNNSIDPKGRASIPAKFREVLVDTFSDDVLVVTQESDGLVAYPQTKWQEIEANVKAMKPGKGRDALYLSRISPATPCTFDKQGRIQLSQSHRDYAGLDSEIREIVVVGVSDKIKIWSKARHAEVRAQAEAHVEQNPEMLAELGF